MATRSKSGGSARDYAPPGGWAKSQRQVEQEALQAAFEQQKLENRAAATGLWNRMNKITTDYQPPVNSSTPEQRQAGEDLWKRMTNISNGETLSMYQPTPQQQNESLRSQQATDDVRHTLSGRMDNFRSELQKTMDPAAAPPPPPVPGAAQSMWSAMQKFSKGDMSAFNYDLSPSYSPVSNTPAPDPAVNNTEPPPLIEPTPGAYWTKPPKLNFFQKARSAVTGFFDAWKDPNVNIYNNPIRSTGAAFTQGAADMAGATDAADFAFRMADKNYKPGSIAQSIRQDADIPQETYEAANFAGNIAGLLAPLKGANMTGGKFLGGIGERLFANAPKLGQKVGTRIMEGLGTGATLTAGQELLQEAGNPSEQTFGQHLQDIGENTAYFGAYGAASPFAESIMTRTGNALPQAAKSALNAAKQRSPIASGVAGGVTEGLLTGTMVGAGYGAAQAIQAGDISKLPQNTWNEAGQEMKENFVESLAMGIVNRLSRGGLGQMHPNVQAQHDAVMQDVSQKVFDQMNPEDQADLNQWIDGQVKQGMSHEDAKLSALDQIASHPQGQDFIDKALNDAIDSHVAGEIAKAPADLTVTDIAGQNMTVDEGPVYSGPEEPAQPPPPPDNEFQPGQKVRVKGIQGEFEVKDVSDRSMVELTNGMKVGFRALAPVEQQAPAATPEHVPIPEVAAPEAPAPAAENVKDRAPQLGDIITLKPAVQVAYGDQKYTIVGDLGKGSLKMRGDNGKEITINKAGIGAYHGQSEVSETDKVQSTYDQMRQTLTTDSGNWKDATKAKHLQQMKSHAEANGIEFHPRYQELLDKFTAGAEQYKNRQRKDPNESWVQAANRMTANEIRTELQGLNMEQLREIRDQEGFPKAGKDKKITLANYLTDQLLKKAKAKADAGGYLTQTEINEQLEKQEQQPEQAPPTTDEGTKSVTSRQYDKLHKQYNFPDVLPNPATLDTEEIQRKLDSIRQAVARPAVSQRVWMGLANREMQQREKPPAKESTAKKKPAAAPAAETKTEAPAQTADTKTPHDKVTSFRLNLRKNTHTLQDVKDTLAVLRDEKDAVKAAILDKINASDNHKRKRKETKAKMVDDAYNRYLTELSYADGDSFVWQPFGEGSYEQRLMKAIEDKVNAMTEESIQAHQDKQRKDAEQKQKVMDNPETLHELRQKKFQVGELSADEQARLDELEALDRKERKQQEQAAKSAVTSTSAYTVEETKHTKTGETLFVVKLKDRVSSDAFKALQRQMGEIGGRWSSFNKGFNFKADPSEKLPAVLGSTEEGESAEQAAPSPIDENAPKENRAAQKLRDVADKMQEKIDDLRRDRPTHTRRMAQQAASSANDADRMERIQKIMFNLADAIESGQATHLDGVSARTHVETLEGILRRRVSDLMSKNNERMSDRDGNPIRRDPTLEDINGMEYPYPVVYNDTLRNLVKEMSGNTKGIVRALTKIDKAAGMGAPKPIKVLPFLDELQTVLAEAKDSPRAKHTAERINDLLAVYKRLQAMGLETPEQLRAAMREFLQYREGTGVSQEERKRRELKAKEGEAVRSNIPGFFPTPTPIVDRMLEEAGIEDGMRVLEPSAGKGNIAEAIRDNIKEWAADKKGGTDNYLHVIEYNNTLHNILEEKDFNVVGDDFLEYTIDDRSKYDRIVMNPPFENGQDIDHVRHAYDLLKPGGRVVAIMSNGPFYRSDKKATDFRNWLDELGGTSEQLPEGAFKSSERPTGVATRIVVIDKPAEEEAAPVAASEPTLYRYYLTLRPPSPGAQPSGAVTTVSFDERQPVEGVGEAWGYVEYNKPIADAADWDMVAAPAEATPAESTQPANAAPAEAPANDHHAFEAIAALDDKAINDYAGSLKRSAAAEVRLEKEYPELQRLIDAGARLTSDRQETQKRRASKAKTEALEQTDRRITANKMDLDRTRKELEKTFLTKLAESPNLDDAQKELVRALADGNRNAADQGRADIRDEVRRIASEKGFPKPLGDWLASRISAVPITEYSNDQFRKYSMVPYQTYDLETLMAQELSRSDVLAEIARYAANDVVDAKGKTPMRELPYKVFSLVRDYYMYASSKGKPLGEILQDAIQTKVESAVDWIKQKEIDLENATNPDVRQKTFREIDDLVLNTLNEFQEVRQLLWDTPTQKDQLMEYLKDLRAYMQREDLIAKVEEGNGAIVLAPYEPAKTMPKKIGQLLDTKSLNLLAGVYNGQPFLTDRHAILMVSPEELAKVNQEREKKNMLPANDKNPAMANPIIEGAMKRESKELTQEPMGAFENGKVKGVVFDMGDGKQFGMNQKYYDYAKAKGYKIKYADSQQPMVYENAKGEFMGIALPYRVSDTIFTTAKEAPVIPKPLPRPSIDSALQPEPEQQGTTVKEYREQKRAAARETAAAREDSGGEALAATSKKKKQPPSATPVQQIIQETTNKLTPRAGKEAADAVAKFLNVTVSRDFVRRAAEGVYNYRNSGAVRVKSRSYYDWRVVGHELGHVFSHQINRIGNKAELKAMAEALYPVKLPEKKKQEEGFAEFFRLWVADPDLAKKNAPITTQKFEDFIAADPKLKKVFDKVRTIVDNDLSGSALGRVINSTSDQIEADEGPLHYKPGWVRRILFNAVDYSIPAKAMMDKAKELAAEQKRGLSTQVDLAHLVSIIGDADAKAYAAFVAPARDNEGRIVEGRSLKSIYTAGIDAIAKELNYKRTDVDGKKQGADDIFSAILLAKRVEERYGRGFTKLPMTYEDARSVIEMAENRWPDALKHAEDFAATYGRVKMDLLERAEIVTKADRNRIEKKSTSYIPIIYDEKSLNTTGQVSNSYSYSNPARHFNGRVAPALNAFQAVMMDMTSVQAAIDYKRVLNAIQDLAAIRGMGPFVQKLPHQMKGVTLSSDRIAEKIIGYLDEETDISGILTAGPMTFFLPDETKFKNKPIVKNVRGGTTTYMELAPDVFKMLLALQPMQINAFGRGLAHFSRFTRAAALYTGRYLTNAVVRDFNTTIIQSKAPLHMLAKHVATSAAAAGHMGENGDATYAAFVQSGALSGATENVLRNLVKHQFRKDMIQTKAPGWGNMTLRGGKQVLVKIVRPSDTIKFFEEMPRINEFLSNFKQEMKKLGHNGDEMWNLYLKKGTDALPPEVQEQMERILVDAAYAANEVTTNFRLRGASAAVRSWTPTVSFLHGSIQGTYRLARQIKDHPLKTTLYTTAYLGLLSWLSWAWMNHDDDDKKVYADIPSSMRDKYWWLPNPFLKGTYLAFSKPFEYAIPANLAERYLDWIQSGEKGARKLTSDLGSLKSTIQIIPGILQTLLDMNYNRDTSGRPILSMSDLNKQPVNRFGSNTSMTAKDIGKSAAWMMGQFTDDPRAGVSPKMIDYFVRQTAGRWGEFGLSVLDSGIRLVETKGNLGEAAKTFKSTDGAEYTTGLGQLVYGQAEGSSRVVSKFYNDLNKAKTLSKEAHDWQADVQEKIKNGKITKLDQVELPPNWVTEKNLTLLSFLPALNSISQEMSTTRNQFQEKISDPNTDPETRRKLTMQLDYIEKLAAGVVYGITPAKPNPDSLLTDAYVEKIRTYIVSQAETALDKEARTKGGVTEQVADLRKVWEHNKK